MRDHVAKGGVKVSHIPGDVQVADIMTKVVSSSKFHGFRSKLRIAGCQLLSLKRDEMMKR